MLIACIVIAYVFFLKYLYDKKLAKERRNSGVAEPSGPADYNTLKKALTEMSERVTGLERAYHELSQREGGLRP